MGVEPTISYLHLMPEDECWICHPELPEPVVDRRDAATRIRDWLEVDDAVE